MQDEIKCLIKESVAANMGELKSIRTYLYENPEVGGEEAKACELLTITMKEHGFNVTTDFHNIDYCFKAEYDCRRRRGYQKRCGGACHGRCGDSFITGTAGGDKG